MGRCIKKPGEPLSNDRPNNPFGPVLISIRTDTFRQPQHKRWRTLLGRRPQQGVAASWPLLEDEQNNQRVVHALHGTGRSFSVESQVARATSPGYMSCQLSCSSTSMAVGVPRTTVHLPKPSPVTTPTVCDVHPISCDR